MNTYLHWSTAHLLRSRGTIMFSEVERIRALDLDLLLDADVPQGHRVHEVPVLLDRVAVMARMVRVVVDAVARHAVLARGVEVGRLAEYVV